MAECLSRYKEGFAVRMNEDRIRPSGGPGQPPMYRQRVGEEHFATGVAFLHCPGLDATNNAAERDPRHGDRPQSVGRKPDLCS